MVTKKKVTVCECVCEVADCGHAWTVIGTKPPGQCQKCRSRTWNGGKKLGRPAKPGARLTSDIGQMPKPRRVRQLEEA